MSERNRTTEILTGGFKKAPGHSTGQEKYQACFFAFRRGSALFFAVMVLTKLLGLPCGKSVLSNNKK